MPVISIVSLVLAPISLLMFAGAIFALTKRHRLPAAQRPSTKLWPLIVGLVLFSVYPANVAVQYASAHRSSAEGCVLYGERTHHTARGLGTTTYEETTCGEFVKADGAPITLVPGAKYTIVYYRTNSLAGRMDVMAAAHRQR